MPITSATVAVATLATSKTVTGTFATPYQVFAETDWGGDVIVSAKVAASFLATFTVPAPTGGGNMDYFVFQPAASGSSTDVDICNQALTLLGANQIVTLSDTSTEGKLCSLHYANVRDEVLRAHTWNFAAVRAILTITGAAPVFGGPESYTCVFTLPAAPYALRVIATNGDEDGEKWRVEGRCLLYTQNSVCVLYTSRVTDPTLYDSLFTTALVYRLAGRLAYPITANATLVASLENSYQTALKRAQAVDGREGTMPSTSATTLTGVR